MHTNGRILFGFVGVYFNEDGLYTCAGANLFWIVGVHFNKAGLYAYKWAHFVWLCGCILLSPCENINKCSDRKKDVNLPFFFFNLDKTDSAT